MNTVTRICENGGGRLFAMVPVILAVSAAFGIAGARTDKMVRTSKWTVYEASLSSKQNYDNPLWDVSVSVEFKSPSGDKREVDAFWDGGQTWRVRFSPSETGKWTWTSKASNTGDKGLNGRKGHFECVPYEGDNVLFRRGRAGQDVPDQDLMYLTKTLYLRFFALTIRRCTSTIMLCLNLPDSLVTAGPGAQP